MCALQGANVLFSEALLCAYVRRGSWATIAAFLALVLKQGAYVVTKVTVRQTKQAQRHTASAKMDSLAMHARLHAQALAKMADHAAARGNAPFKMTALQCAPVQGVSWAQIAVLNARRTFMAMCVPVWANVLRRSMKTEY